MLTAMRDFKKLRVWQLAHALTLAIYHDTKSFPPNERYGLVAQLRRASASIASNIAEGAGRRSPAEYSRFLDIALASGNEVEYQLLLARDLGYLVPSTHAERSEQAISVRRGCFKLQQTILADARDS